MIGKTKKKFSIAPSGQKYTYMYNVQSKLFITCYNRIFNIRHQIAGNGSVSIKIPSF